ncbi:LysR family transcriptional regulator [Pseudomonas gingeri]|uniref:LysR family transcriptional regulator n=1 Tax=Pseudomonas gingeri TaxID=117681 RepID=A0A7Y7XJF1_9PSED|nr:LysR family transcriptional regulator [Pseudomonas gingeri]NWA29156.1 LysR family transcriptional regulator [Pseudomonas gingeri]NWC00766.1 LysR family transcriptional regulator [Pseudomonas gingeri]NWD72268.1 LysR family transcriptional regulator [Pseudomonas gingeri]NWD76539.1 LysR family transcriptional regulator [Pseudomonas gingeri]
MKLTNIDMDLLRALVYVSNTQGFTKAAEQLFRTQSAISLQIKKLEQITHEKLLERGKEIRLTPAGLKVYDYAQQILKLNDELIHSITHERPPPHARIGLPEHHDPALIEKIIRSTFSSNIQCSFFNDDAMNLSRMVEHHLLDIAFILQTELVGALEIAVIPLSWVSAKGSRLYRNDIIRLAVPPQGSVIRRLTQQTLTDNAQRFTVICSSGDFTHLKTTIVTDQAIGVMPTQNVPDALGIVNDHKLPDLPQARLFIKISAQASDDVKTLASAMIRACTESDWPLNTSTSD